MRVCVAEFPDEIALYEAGMAQIADHVATEAPDLLVLPEMPFTPWIFCVEARDTTLWKETLLAHAQWRDRLAGMIPTPILTSEPVERDGRRLNEAIFLDGDRKRYPLRSKHYLPNDYPAIEQVWFDEGDTATGVFDLLGHPFAVQLCSEIMYGEIPRLLAAQGARIIVQSRATGDHPRWRAASLLAAATSGCFVLGANRRSADRDWFTGGSWVYGPDGTLLGETSASAPCLTVEIALNEAEMAQNEYPRSMFAHYAV